MTKRMTPVLAAVLVVCGAAFGCSHDVTAPSQGPLAISRWMGDGACLAVTDDGCNFVAGCGHGVFSRPLVSREGTFDIDGRYRIEVGPISITPAPPAHFSGIVTDTHLTLTVVPGGTLSAASYSMTKTTAGTCLVPCL
jgi:hypothetical protein